MARTRDVYLDNITEALRLIKDGETYEVCLTTQIFSEAQVDPLDFYLSLRKRNPAPYGAFLRFGDDGEMGVVLASSSPEKFLKVDRKRMAESKPIKGTLPRGNTPEEDEALKVKLQTSVKDFSENLMAWASSPFLSLLDPPILTSFASNRSSISFETTWAVSVK